MAPDTQEVGGSPAAKKSKTTSPLVEVVSEAVLNAESEIRERYQASTPYPHAQIHDLFDPDFLTGVKDEIKSQAKVNFKESDLFRVYQSIDMANLDTQPELARELPLVMRLREVLYSQEWRSFVERLAGLPPSTLTDKIDCACNCHAPGCHLLCHDDVIGTRKISYIIYLTEPDWEPQEGGSLELYGPQIDDDPNSLPIPAARAWPTFNSMAFFVVQPGASYHAVQEVIGDRPRLSLQGWYHATEPPENIELATLQQLKKLNDEVAADNDRSDSKLVVQFSEETAKEFSDDDKAYLSKYMKEEYLTDESMSEIQKKFADDNCVQLRDFLLDKWVPKIEALKPPKYDDAYYKTGVSSEWTLQGPAHKQRYLVYKSDAKSLDDCPMVGSLLHHVKTKVFESEAFGRYLSALTGLDPSRGVETSQIRRFRPGLDYTVGHYGLLVNESVLDATMCFVHDPTEDEQAMWESGDCGGFECYIEADDDDDEGGTGGAADEYNEEDDTELLSVRASNNTLSLVYRDPGTMRFVKYVGSSAPSSRYDICMVYQVPPSEDDDDDEDEGESRPFVPDEDQKPPATEA